MDESKPSVERFSFKPDDKFNWNKHDKFKPNFEGERLNGKMTILNYKNTHFNLIIDKNHALYQEGSLMFQQKISSNTRELVDSLFTKDTKITERSATDVPKEQKDPEKDEHIHCHREEETCLDRKYESELVSIKKELDKYKLALKEEVEKRSKAEDMLKALQTVPNINVTENRNRDNSPSESTNSKTTSVGQIVCGKCDYTFETNNELEYHMKFAHQDKKCDDCSKQYSTIIQIKRHYWRSHENIDCNACGENLPNRHDLKRHKIEKHNITKVQDCKFFKEGHCVDENECLYNHVIKENLCQQKEQATSKGNDKKICTNCYSWFKSDSDLEKHNNINHTKQKCDKCPKEYTNKFEVSRHQWRSHEQIDCNYCGNTLSSRHELKRHKENDHKIKMNQECRFFFEGKCVDSEECLFSHSKTGNQGKQKRAMSKTETDFCKDGLNCPRVDCEYSENHHRRIKDVPCKFQESCAKQECPFKHNLNLVFQKNQKSKRKM